MSRLPLLLAAALATSFGLAAVAPANAASVASCQTRKVLTPGGVKVDRIQIFAQQYAMQLRQLGYDVERVEPWGGCIRAFVTDADGHSRMQFFDPDTLEPLSTN